MMNDRFSVQLRQHLLETANERPGDGQFATIVGDVAATPQRRPLIARLSELRVRIGPVPAAVRYGLIALALVLAAVAGGILAGGGTPSPSTPFEGTWTAIDVPDGSTMNLYVGAGPTPAVRYEDLLATGDVCRNDEVKVFTADGVGEITRRRLEVTFPNGGGCGLETIPIAATYTYDQNADTLTDQDGIVWTRIAGGDAAVPTLVPEPSSSSVPSPTPGTVFAEGCIDLTHGGTYTAPAGAMSLTAIVPATPAVPWQGSRDLFALAGACDDVSPIAFFASMETSTFEMSCIPDSPEITTFADAVARLDTPKGEDISPRIDLIIDGHPAARWDIVDLSTCSGFGLWHMTTIGAGETGSIYVIDVDGVLLEMELNRDGSQTLTELEEAYAIVASLQITR
jgi:hypothetical protein